MRAYPKTSETQSTQAVAVEVIHGVAVAPSAAAERFTDVQLVESLGAEALGATLAAAHSAASCRMGMVRPCC